MKVSYEKAIEVINEIKLNVDKQQYDTKYVKEQCDMDDGDEVKEITVARTPMTNKKHVCVTSNQTFAMENQFKKTFPGRAHNPV